MEPGTVIELTRDCEVTLIPEGTKATIAKGTSVRVTQSLGGTHTVVTEQGPMVSISSENADALGVEAAGSENQYDENMDKDEFEKCVWEKLKTCYDPEIPHNIVDLGLIYGCNIIEKDGLRTVGITMTLTAPGCGMGDWLAQDIRTKVSVLPKVEKVHVEVVFDPPWDKEKMSPALRRQMNL